MKTDNLKVVMVVLGLLVVGLAGTSLMFYKQAKNLKVDPQKQAQEENKKIIESINRYKG